MSDIEFRAWDKIRDDFFTPSMLCFPLDCYSGKTAVRDVRDVRDVTGYNCSDWVALDEMVLERYTTKKDKHGVKIFEGDRVRILYTDWPSQTDYSVSLDEYKKSISKVGTIVFWNARFEIDFNGYHGSIFPGEHGELEIIGHIHEGAR